MDYIRNMKSSTFETKTPDSQISHIGHLNLIHESSHIRHVALIVSSVWRLTGQSAT